MTTATSFKLIRQLMDDSLALEANMLRVQGINILKSITNSDNLDSRPLFSTFISQNHP